VFRDGSVEIGDLGSPFNMFEKEKASLCGGGAVPAIVKGTAEVVSEQSHVQRNP
jgi:hypothetical protein